MGAIGPGDQRVNVTLFRFAPRGPVRFGRGDAGANPTTGSDTLFSALCLALRDLYGPVRLASFLRAAASGEAPVRFSSLVPYIGDTTLLPTPLLGTNTASWVSPSRFAALIQGTDPGDATTMQDGIVAVNAGEAATEKVWQEATFGSDSTRAVVFAPDCGLAAYAVVSPDWNEYVQAALKSLGDSGFGGRRSRGFGQFDVTQHTADLPTSPNAAAYCVLSRYVPTASELADGVLNNGARVRLIDSSGVIGSPDGAGTLRKRLRMVAEGSIVSPASGHRPPNGQLVDVTPDGFTAHRVFRCGWALAVGVAPAAVSTEVVA